uniref:Secreted protein n=1 Tax=Opuntia streptacantha TaxID=393608 RepID=A0A7C9ACK1_OPUST
MALSVRPLRSLAIVAHLLPNLAWALMMISSSSGENGRCSTSGESWLHHRSRQDLPDLPGIDLLINDQFRAPCRWTSFCKSSSSSGLHGPLIRSAAIDASFEVVWFSIILTLGERKIGIERVRNRKRGRERQIDRDRLGTGESGR